MEVGACGRGLICGRLLPDVCNRCVSHECVNKCDSERAYRCLPKLAHHLFSFKLLKFSDTAEVKYRNPQLLNEIWLCYVNFATTGTISSLVDNLSPRLSQLVSDSVMILSL